LEDRSAGVLCDLQGNRLADRNAERAQRVRHLARLGEQRRVGLEGAAALLDVFDAGLGRRCGRVLERRDQRLVVARTAIRTGGEHRCADGMRHGRSGRRRRGSGLHRCSGEFLAAKDELVGLFGAAARAARTRQNTMAALLWLGEISVLRAIDDTGLGGELRIDLAGGGEAAAVELSLGGAWNAPDVHSITGAGGPARIVRDAVADHRHRTRKCAAAQG
jgi:hypothetical protein